MDADLVADLDLGDAEPLAQRLNLAFYADVEMMRDAVQRRSSFNLISPETMFKVSVFAAGSRPFDQAQSSRREMHLPGDATKTQACVITAEDIVP